jgi:hypothetical protein
VASGLGESSVAAAASLGDGELKAVPDGLDRPAARLAPKPAKEVCCPDGDFPAVGVGARSAGASTAHHGAVGAQLGNGVGVA